MDKEQIRQRWTKATKGPYKWEVSTKHKVVRLQGDRPPGYFVMKFDRWGMRGAAPEFRDQEHDIMRRVEHYAVQRVPHHVGWDQWINHPDAEALAHSWQDVHDLLSALDVAEAREAELRKALTVYVDEFGGIHDEGCSEDDTCDCEKVRLVNEAMKDWWMWQVATRLQEG